MILTANRKMNSSIEQLSIVDDDLGSTSSSSSSGSRDGGGLVVEVAAAPTRTISSSSIATLIDEQVQTGEIGVRTRKSRRTTATQQSSTVESSPPTQQQQPPPPVAKPEPVVIDIEKDNQFFCIDLTKDADSDDVAVISVQQKPLTVARKRTNRRNTNGSNSGSSSSRTTTQQDANSTIIIDDERSEPTSSGMTYIRSTPSPTQLFTLPPLPFQLQSSSTQTPFIIPQPPSVVVQPSPLQLPSITASPPKRMRTTTTTTTQLRSTVYAVPPTSPPQPSRSLPTCPICLENLDELKSHHKNLMVTMCGHIICNKCVDEHFKASSTRSSTPVLCPTCRQKITKSKIHGIYL